MIGDVVRGIAKGLSVGVTTLVVAAGIGCAASYSSAPQAARTDSYVEGLRVGDSLGLDSFGFLSDRTSRLISNPDGSIRIESSYKDSKK